MNEHNSEHWGDQVRRHRGERSRARQRFGGFPGPGSDGTDFPAGRRFREGDFGPGFDGPGFAGPRGFGPGPHGGPAFHGEHGFHAGPPRGGPRGRGYGRRGGRAKRGDVRAAALALLTEEPMNGYQIIQQISDRSGGLWRPSPGSVYPALAQLEDEGLVSVQGAESGRRAYALTDAGRTYVAEHAEELKSPWSAMAGDAASAAVDMRKLVGQVHLAAFQVVSAGTDAQLSQARTVLAQARRALYRILAEDDQPDGDEPADEARG
ncbi:MAG TPA: PadR family transcriptional regulator [Streptosporangiaceae bacterium]